MVKEAPGGTTFERCALASGLLVQEQLDAAREAIRLSPHLWPASRFSPNDEQIAHQLVELRLLNAWQAQQLLAGRTRFNLGAYWIIDYIGRGGMGQVYKAEHEQLGVVAIKVLPRAKCTPETIASFLREIKAQFKLNHGNLVRALDAGQDNNVYYLVTEFVPGCDLRKMVRSQGPLGMEVAANIISQAAAGLEHAHEQGMVHRDVKPGNILVTPEGHAKLSDLGLAGSIDGNEENDPRLGKIMGTADYLSPEHILDPRSPMPSWDIYSLGCTLYYAVTGKVPFPGGTTSDKAKAHIHLKPLDPRRLNPALIPAFVDAMADMMAKKPAERIPTAGEVIRRLKPWVCATWQAPDEKALGLARAGSFLAQGPAGPDSFQTKDTAASLPELRPTLPQSSGGLREAFQPTRPVASANEETPSLSSLVRSSGERASSVLRPLWFFIGLPAVLVGLTAAAWLLSRWLGQHP